MQSPRCHVRFPVASTPTRDPCRFRCQKSLVPDVPIWFPVQGHEQQASYFQGRNFRPQHKCLRTHLPKLGSRLVRHNRGLWCIPSLLRLVLQSFSYIRFCNCNDDWRLMSSAGRSVSPCFQYSVQSLGRDRFRFISPYTTARLDKRQKFFAYRYSPPFC